MTAFDTLDGLAAWLDARRGIAEEWLQCCEFTPSIDSDVARPADGAGHGRPMVVFAGCLFGSDGGQSSGGGSSGASVVAA